MERKKIQASAAIILVSVLAWGCVSTGSASAAPITAAQANADYAASIADAKANFLSAVKPSRTTMINEGKRAEAVRRLTVKRALATFTAVVTAEKAASLTAEKTYKASVAQFVATPTSLSLKAAVKTNLAALTKATAALAVDAKITAARAVFAKARTTAMDKFKLVLAISAKERTKTRDRASMRYKAEKAKALAKLQADLKKASK